MALESNVLHLDDAFWGLKLKMCLGVKGLSDSLFGFICQELRDWVFGTGGFCSLGANN